MEEIPLSALDDARQTLAGHARTALERGNFDYALSLCERLLAHAPGCVEIRRLQRQAQLRQASAGASKWGSLTLRRAVIALRDVLGGKRSSARQLLHRAERRLARDPRDVSALRQLASAARSLALPETTAFALEALCELRPTDRAALLALGEAWLWAGKPEEALRIADALLRRNAVDGDAQSLLRQASVAETLAQGTWSAAKTKG